MQIITENIEWLLGLIIAAFSAILGWFISLKIFISGQKSRNEAMITAISELQKQSDIDKARAAEIETRVAVIETKIDHIPAIHDSTIRNNGLLQKLLGMVESQQKAHKT